MYKSPIDLIYNQPVVQLEGDILKAIQNVGINVDKEELTRALQYDRDQYELGYQDGKSEAVPQGTWEYWAGSLLCCSVCGYEYNDYLECKNYCGNCGARMMEDLA